MRSHVRGELTSLLDCSIPNPATACSTENRRPLMNAHAHTASSGLFSTHIAMRTVINSHNCSRAASLEDRTKARSNLSTPRVVRSACSVRATDATMFNRSRHRCLLKLRGGQPVPDMVYTPCGRRDLYSVIKYLCGVNTSCVFPQHHGSITDHVARRNGLFCNHPETDDEPSNISVFRHVFG